MTQTEDIGFELGKRYDLDVRAAESLRDATYVAEVDSTQSRYQSGKAFRFIRRVDEDDEMLLESSARPVYLWTEIDKEDVIEVEGRSVKAKRAHAGFFDEHIFNSPTGRGLALEMVTQYEAAEDLK
jgi:hypothetical protein